MDAVLLREAGGLGDILQVGSTVPLLHGDGYMVHLYTLADPAIVALARLIRGLNQVHPLRVSISDRRSRSANKHFQFSYLHCVLTHAHGTGRGSKNKLFDMFCPAWGLEQRELEGGSRPITSRAEAFCHGAGHPGGQAKPTKLRRPPGVEDFMAQVKARVGGPYTIFAPWARDPCRSLQPDFIYTLAARLANDVGPVVVLDYHTGEEHRREIPNVFWYPWDFMVLPERDEAVHQTVALVWDCARVVTVESFPMHLAGSLKKPTVALGGPTTIMAMASHYPTVTGCTRRDRPECWGCYYWESRGFRPTCRTEGCNVLAQLTADDVIEKLQEVAS